jgi:hypothetical protein
VSGSAFASTTRLLTPIAYRKASERVMPWLEASFCSLSNGSFVKTTLPRFDAILALSTDPLVSGSDTGCQQKFAYPCCMKSGDTGFSYNE